MKTEKNFFSDNFRSKRSARFVLMAFVLLIAGIGAPPVKTQAEAYKQYPVAENWLDPVEIEESEETVGLTRRGGALPSRFDARQKGWITPIKNQGNANTCWAFSTIAAIEANLVKNGKAASNLDLSENHLAYFFYNRQKDPIGYTEYDYNRTRQGDYLKNGGTLQGTALALTTWAGVTTEAKSPYLTKPASGLCYNSDYLVKNVYLYNYNVTTASSRERTVATIKQAVLDHGAVAIGIHMFETTEEVQKFWNPKKAAYYSTSEDGNHAVTIVGWDDSFSKNNFSTKPSVDGAWIIKNSYGTAFGDKGYMYVSYQDVSLSEPVAFEMVKKAELYDNNYQHDGTANPVYCSAKGEWYANEFIAKGAKGYNEELKAVGVYVLAEDVDYEIQVYTGLSNAGKPTSGTKAFASPVKGHLTNGGYQMIELPKAVSLVAGEKFAIHVRLKNSSRKNAPIGADYSMTASFISFIAHAEKNQSFAKIGGKWQDAGKEGINFRIKAYTDATNTKAKFSLSNSNQSLSKGASTKLSLRTNLSNVYRTVTWKSANGKVASVNKNGKVKGVSYGSTTITASFVEGGKKKTLKCKVTVGPAAMKGYTVTGGKKLNVKWKKNQKAQGYEIYYATRVDGTYKKLTTITKNSKKSYSKKLATGTYYVKMRPYLTKNRKKLYGSFTSAKAAVIE